jgi:branched-chain amino acid transport system ATP-binding protein
LTEGGQSIVLVEQNAYQSLKLADHFYVLENGRIASGGTPDEMRQDRRIQKAYLGL